jgi:hypothetical protein
MQVIAVGSSLWRKAANAGLPVTFHLSHLLPHGPGHRCSNLSRIFVTFPPRPYIDTNYRNFVRSSFRREHSAFLARYKFKKD